MTDYAALKQEIQQDPARLGLAALVAAQNWQGAADVLNQPVAGAATSEPVPRTDLIRILLGAGKLATIAAPTAEELAAMPAPVAILTRSMAWILSHPDYAFIDVAGATGKQMIPMLVQAGLITQAEADQVLALGTVSRSRAQVVFGLPVSRFDVQKALS